MIGPHYKYLTNQYVEAMGMEPWLHPRPEPLAVWVPELSAKPVTMIGYDRVVVYNHRLYVQTPCGRAWE